MNLALQVVGVGGGAVPLTEKVMFTTPFQKAGKLQIPKLIRWRFKLESNQALKVDVNFLELHKGWQFFYAKMCKDGRITVPKLTLRLVGVEAEVWRVQLLK